MSNLSDTNGSRSHGPRAAKKLLQAAALAASLVPLGAVAAEPSIIVCGSGICSENGSYSSGASGSNTWKFEYGGATLYTLTIEGVAANSFSLNVQDRQVPVFTEGEPDFVIPYPGAQCIPMANETTCVIFDIFENGEANWVDGYYAEIRWFGPDDSVMKPPDDGLNHIFKSEDGFTFNEVLVAECPETLGTNCYNPEIDPVDPGLGGKGTEFSSIMGGRADSVPEPATLSLLGVGVAAALHRRRKHRRP
jgi:hypothetical protein